jgi:hypothetical protein
MSNLISKYNISEKDLYSLGIIESKKRSLGYLEKEKLKAVSLKILKPYNVKFMDLGGLLSEIKEGGFDHKYSESLPQEEKSEIEKMIQENSNVSKFYKEWWSGKSKKQKWVIAIAVLFTLGLIGNLTEEKNKNSTNSSSAEEESVDGLYTYEDNSAKLSIRVSGSSWFGKTLIVSGFGEEYDNQNAQYDNGIIKGKELFENSGMVKVGYISGNSLTTSIGGQSVTLRK